MNFKNAKELCRLSFVKIKENLKKKLKKTKKGNEPQGMGTIQILDINNLNNFKDSKEWNIIKISFGDKPNLHSLVKDPTLSTNAKSVKGTSQNVLKVNYMKNSYVPSADIDGGIGFYASPSLFPTKSARLSYEIFFPSDFNPVKGGKLPGLFIGTPGGASGGNHVDNKASCRLMWRANMEAEAYVYLPDDQDASYNNIPKLIKNSKHGDSLWRGEFNFKKGEWNKIIMMLTLNTESSVFGELTLTINGISRTFNKMKWVTSESANIDSIIFETFFGGNSTDFATPVNTSIYFKNFIIEKIQQVRSHPRQMPQTHGRLVDNHDELK